MKKMNLNFGAKSATLIPAKHSKKSCSKPINQLKQTRFSQRIAEKKNIAKKNQEINFDEINFDKMNCGQFVAKFEEIFNIKELEEELYLI